MGIKEWMTGEEARRNAVEEVLEQLLARDTQYRKELSCHLDNRMEIAKRRRSFHRQQYREYIAALNNSQEERVQQRLSLLDEESQQKKRSLRDSIMEKYHRVVSNSAGLLKEKHLKRIRSSRRRSARLR